MKKSKICFIITSVVYVSEKSLGYSTVRSEYTPDERISQTLKTIGSIRVKVPNAEIILIEGGSWRNQLNILKEQVDKFIHIGRNRFVRKAVNSKSKGYGEAMMLLFSRLYIKKYEMYFKLSGRYYLNDYFDLQKWLGNTKISGKDVYGDQKELSTRLLFIPGSQFNLYYYSLLRRIHKLYKGAVLEGVILKIIGPANVHFIDVIGVSGYIGVNGKYIEE